jgi:hypothetical protein
VTCRATQGKSLISEAAIGAVIRLYPPENAAVPDPKKDTNGNAAAPKPEEESNETNKLGTEVAAQKTAEFLATVTEIARRTESASAQGVHNFNGFFGMTEEGQGCMPGAHSSRTIQIIVDFGHNTATGTFSGGGDGRNLGVVCAGITFDMTCSSKYSGSLGSGIIDPASGSLSFSGGSVNGSMNCQFTHCKQNGVDIDCPSSSGITTYSGAPVVSGHVDKNSLSGNGKISVCTNCQGDWSAGQ